jgi:hypothetical protein
MTDPRTTRRAPFDARDNKLAASLRILSRRVAALETRLGMAPAPNPMHRPAERDATLNGEDHGHGSD